MDFGVLENINECVKHLVEDVAITGKKESFFLKKEDITLIGKGRKEYDDGKAISGEQLRKEVEGC